MNGGIPGAACPVACVHSLRPRKACSHGMLVRQATGVFIMHEAMGVQVVAQSTAVTGAVAASGAAFAAVTLPNGSAAPDNPFAAAAARRSADAERADSPAAEGAAGCSASTAVDRAASVSSAADMPLNAAASARVWKAPSMSDAYALFDDKSNHSSPRAGDLVCDARLPAAGRRPSLGKSSMSNMCAFRFPVCIPCRTWSVGPAYAWLPCHPGRPSLPRCTPQLLQVHATAAGWRCCTQCASGLTDSAPHAAGMAASTTRPSQRRRLGVQQAVLAVTQCLVCMHPLGRRAQRHMPVAAAAALAEAAAAAIWAGPVAVALLLEAAAQRPEAAAMPAASVRRGGQ